MRGMKLYPLEPRFESPCSGISKIVPDLSDFFHSHLSGNFPQFLSESYGAWSNGLPAAFFFRQVMIALPWPRRACFSSSMGNLYAGNAVKFLQERGDSGQRRYL